MRAQIEALAQRGAPSVSLLIEHDRRDYLADAAACSARSTTPTSRAIGFAEVPDTVALFAWLHKDALIKRLDARDCQRERR